MMYPTLCSEFSTYDDEVHSFKNYPLKLLLWRRYVAFFNETLPYQGLKFGSLLILTTRQKYIYKSRDLHGI